VRKTARKAISSHPYDDRGTPEFQARVTYQRVKTDLGEANRIRDLRPIDKYYRWYCEDEARDVSEGNRRGLGHAQFLAASRLHTLYLKAHMSPVPSTLLTHAATHGTRAELYAVEVAMEAVHAWQHVTVALSKGSLEIARAIACEGVTLGEFEKHKNWRRGYGILRLREALEELRDIFREQRQNSD
jgi:hypothetical protein